MHGNGYLKFILTVLVLVIAFLGYMLVTAVDRVRESNMRILAKLDELPTRGFAAAPGGALPAVEGKEVGEFANAEFHDPAAQVGGRLIQATQADTANMNVLINSEATAQIFYGLCSSSLAERNYAKPEVFQPVLAESWTISDDHKVYRIKLRKGIYWNDFTDPVTGKQHRDVEVTAEDFKFFVDVVKNPKVNCEPQRVYYQDLESVKVINRYEFEVRWSKEYFGSLANTLGLTPLPRQLSGITRGRSTGRSSTRTMRGTGSSSAADPTNLSAGTRIAGSSSAGIRVISAIASGPRPPSKRWCTRSSSTRTPAFSRCFRAILTSLISRRTSGSSGRTRSRSATGP